MTLSIIPSVEPVLMWLKEEMANYGPALTVLAALLSFSKQIRRAVNGGLLGGPVDAPRVAPAVLWTIGLLPAAFWLWSVWLSQAREPVFIRFTTEDHWMENAQAVLVGCSSVLSGVIARSLWRARRYGWAGLYILLALGFFYLMGEEISWGQRLLHIQTPAWIAERNRQAELNVHNMAWVSEESSDWFDRLFSWVAFLSAAAWVTGLNRSRALRLGMWLPHLSLIPALGCVISYGELCRLYELLYPEAGGASEVLWRLHEPKELILYFGCTAFLLLVYLGLQGGRPGRRATHRATMQPTPSIARRDPRLGF